MAKSFECQIFLGGWQFDTCRHLINERDIRLSQITLFLFIDPAKSGILPPTRQLIQEEVNRPEPSETFTLPQLFLVE
jgi:hypothetical protein